MMGASEDDRQPGEVLAPGVLRPWTGPPQDRQDWVAHELPLRAGRCAVIDLERRVAERHSAPTRPAHVRDEGVRRHAARVEAPGPHLPLARALIEKHDLGGCWSL